MRDGKDTEQTKWRQDPPGHDSMVPKPEGIRECGRSKLLSVQIAPKKTLSFTELKE